MTTPIRSLPNITQGDDYRTDVRLSSQGLPIDFTGYTAAAQLRRSSADTDASIDATFTTTITGDIVTLTLPKATTLTLTGNYVWDLQMTDSDGNRRTVARGPVTITPEVTR